MLELDFTNTLTDALGANGIAPEDFTSIETPSRNAIEALENARREGRLGFANLPFDEGTTAAAQEFARTRACPTTLLVGIGGSALGPAALDAALAPPNSNEKARRAARAKV